MYYGRRPGIADLIVAELRVAVAKATRARNITETCFIHNFGLLLYCSRRTVGLLPTVDSIWGSTMLTRATLAGALIALGFIIHLLATSP